MKINTKKFIRNILICVVAWIVVSYILNYAPGFKRDKFVGITKLIINDKDVTEELKDKILIAENGSIYCGLDDIKELFDKNIYYNKEQNLIVTTSNTKIAAFKLEDEMIKINGLEQVMKAKAFEYEDIIYIPISELDNVYNLEISYVADMILLL